MQNSHIIKLKSYKYYMEVVFIIGQRMKLTILYFGGENIQIVGKNIFRQSLTFILHSVIVSVSTKLFLYLYESFVLQEHFSKELVSLG